MFTFSQHCIKIPSKTQDQLVCVHSQSMMEITEGLNAFYLC